MQLWGKLPIELQTVPSKEDLKKCIKKYRSTALTAFVTYIFIHVCYLLFVLSSLTVHRIPGRTCLLVQEGNVIKKKKKKKKAV